MSKGKLVLVPSGGLANRMRAVASAYHLCAATESRLQVVWFRDWALNAAFRDIFEPIDGSLLSLREARWWDFAVNDRPRRRNLWLPYAAQRMLYGRRLYEHHIGEIRDRGFDFGEWQRGHRCYMSCCQVFGDFPGSIYKRLFRPVGSVAGRVAENTDRFSAHTIGMHIRRTDNQRSIDRSPTRLFIEAGRKELEQHTDLKIFLATDSEDVKAELRREFGSIVMTPEAEACRDSVDGIRGGLTDMYTLACTDRIYGSACSSFSEMAAAIGGKELKVLEL